VTGRRALRRCLLHAAAAIAWGGAPMAAAPALAQGEPAAVPPDVARTLGVQFTDAALRAPGWREKLDLAARAGASVVRVDLNWPWTETEPGRYTWSVYDAFAAELAKRRLRPLFILHRPNRLHGRLLAGPVGADGDGVVAPPQAPDEVAAFARWAAAAALRFKAFDPIWEIWNEPDGEGFWPPRPDPGAYTRLARAACRAIRRAVPDAFVAGPAAAEMPTVWDGTKPLVEAVLRDDDLMTCLSAVSLHTHRFGQAPETVSRDYAVFRRVRSALGARILPLIDTEWGDSVYRGGLTEARQAAWLPRMFLTNLMEGVRLTNWYCLVDTGDDDGEMEDRFGLVTRTGRTRPSFRAYEVLSRELRGFALREVIARFDPATATGSTILLFCDDRQACKLAAWTTDAGGAPARVAGWTRAGPAVGHLGQALKPGLQGNDAVSLSLTPDVQYVPVVRSPGRTAP
jgi:polysaccharide biosynthesis protein PslG